MSILKAKPWQVFLVLLAPYFASWYVTDAVISAGLVVLGAVLLVGWLVMVGNALLSIGPPIEGYFPTWFFFNSLVVVAALVYSFLTQNPDFLLTGLSFHANGFWTLLMIYTVLAYLQLHWFPASLLIAKEQGQRPDFSQVIGWFLLLFFWPIGVWFFQDRLNTFAKKQGLLPSFDNRR